MKNTKVEEVKVEEQVVPAEVEVKDTKVNAIPDQKPTLHQIAIVLDVPYGRLANAHVAYAPIPGEVFEKGKINWDKVHHFIENHLERAGFDTVGDVITTALNTEYTPKRRQTSGESCWNKFLFGTTPVRKGNVKVGTIIHDNKFDVNGEVVFANDTIVCYNPIKDTEEVVTEAIGNRVFNNRFTIVEEEK